MARLRLKNKYRRGARGGDSDDNNGDQHGKSVSPIWNSKWKVLWVAVVLGTISFLSFQAEHSTWTRLVSFNGSSVGKKLPFMKIVGTFYADKPDENENENLRGKSTGKSKQPTSTTLRYDWRNLEVQSPLGKELVAHQTNCSLPLAYFPNRNAAGLGSDLHVYGMAMCNAHRNNVRVFTPFPWMYWDEEACKEFDDGGSSMACYFPKLELQCPEDRQAAAAARNAFASKSTQRLNWQGAEDRLCTSLLGQEKFNGQFKIPDLRAAITEFQFRSVGDVVIREAERQLALVFPNGVPDPETLITVHVRWGDKGSEMKLHPIGDYIGATQQMAEHRGLKPSEVNVFLASEDPQAVKEFKEKSPKEWKIHVDQFYLDMLPNRQSSVAHTASNLNGRTGLLALGSMLVSMQANSYVLTTGSNWSRVMNELRKNVVSPRCGKCTALIDVQPDNTPWETAGTPPLMNEQQGPTLQEQRRKDPNAVRVMDRPAKNIDGSKWQYVQMRNGHYIRVPKTRNYGRI